MLQRIVKLFHSNKYLVTEKWLKNLPYAVNLLEERLYSFSSSLKEYLDEETFANRLKQQTLGMLEKPWLSSLSNHEMPGLGEARRVKYKTVFEFLRIKFRQAVHVVAPGSGKLTSYQQNYLNSKTQLMEALLLYESDSLLDYLACDANTLEEKLRVSWGTLYSITSGKHHSDFNIVEVFSRLCESPTPRPSDDDVLDAAFALSVILEGSMSTWSSTFMSGIVGDGRNSEKSVATTYEVCNILFLYVLKTLGLVEEYQMRKDVLVDANQHCSDDPSDTAADREHMIGMHL
jgi:hypothetical protein